MTDLVSQTNSLLPNDIEKEIEALRNQIMPGAQDGDLKLFAKFCAKTQLDPFSRQIYAINRGGKFTYQTSIDGFRVIAERSGSYRGQTPVYWCDQDGVWVDVWLKDWAPSAAKVGVYRSDAQEPIWGVARFKSYAQEYNGRPGGLWGKMPEVMIAKVAEALALRKAFPNDLSGLYTGDEMEQASNTEPLKRPVRHQVEPEKKEIEVLPKENPFKINEEMVEEIHQLKEKSGADPDSMRKALTHWGAETVRDLNEKQFTALKNRYQELVKEKDKEKITKAIDKASDIFSLTPKERGSAKSHTFKID